MNPNTNKSTFPRENIDIDSNHSHGNASCDLDDIEKVNTRETARQNELDHIPSHISAQDIHAVAVERERHGEYDMDETIYQKFSPHRKTIICAVVSFCGLLAPISSTSILSAIPEVTSTFHTKASVTDLTNAFYMLAMGISPTIWGPLSQIYGRRWICIYTASLFTVFNICTAVSPNLPAFFVFRILTALQGTSFLTMGASIIGDIYKPTERATAMGWFLSGTLIGPAFGPFIGGIIVTFRSWRVIFWLQTALGGLGTILVVIFLPETIHYAKCDELVGLPPKRKFRKLAQWTSPWRVIALFSYPNIIAAGFASSSLTWNMYSLLTPIRYVLNPRFNLTSPLQSGLFYLAPGCGYLLGTFFGGRYADYWVKKYLKRRNGERVPEDRLNSCLPFMGIVIPGCMLVYGWAVEKAVGGIPLVVIVMFAQGVAQLFCFPSLNTYCVDVMQSRSGEVVAGNYVIRYLFACLGTALVLPAVESIGVGWFSTISAAFVCGSAILLWTTTIYGKAWREKTNARKERKRKARVAKKLERAQPSSSPSSSSASSSTDDVRMETTQQQVGEKVQ
ncbi:MAG: hypothetical protein M1834_008552 [Cirrosporium novae-zelandiae]|nr:MAG: hypothetical protein M1834_008552 [Cirrosporium novae-zelandiae]